MPSPFDRSPRGESPHGMTVVSAAAPDPRSSGLSYESFYGLKEQPFSLSTDPRYFYSTRSHAAAFEDFRNAIERRERVIVLTGDVGTGKTTLCRAICAEFERSAVTALVPDPAISRQAFLKILLAHFSAVTVDDLTGRLHGASETEARLLLRAHLRTLAADSTIGLVVIDEAQKISPEIADEISLLTDEDEPLHVILVGQLDLAETLASHDMRRLDQRASARCTLAPLDRAGVAGYISYRLQKAGGSPDRIRFSDEAVDAIQAASGGLPRLVNRLCDRALTLAHAQRAELIDRGMIQPAESTAVRTEPLQPALAPAPSAAAAVPPPSAPAGAPSEGGDPVDAWLAGIDDGAVRPTAILLPDVDTAEPSPAADPIAYTPRTSVNGIVIRVRLRRRTPVRRRYGLLERRTDRWARRLGTILLALTALLGAAVAAPTIVDVSSGLWSYVRSAFDSVAALSPAADASEPPLLPTRR